LRSGESAFHLAMLTATSADLKVMMEVAVRDFAREMVQRIAMEDLKAQEQAKAQGFEVVNWSPEERRNFRKIAQEAWADWAKKSPLSQKVYDSQTAFLKKLQLL
jgi:TRAP-type mannitol/chloroaromatic compound transport system substrate-binding protein